MPNNAHMLRGQPGNAGQFRGAIRSEVDPDETVDKEAYLDDVEACTYKVHASTARIVLRKVEAANKRLEKRGIEGRFEVEVEPYTKIEKNDSGEMVQVDYARLTFNSMSIAKDGYEVLGRIDPVGDSFVTSTGPGVTLNGWRPTDLTCAHCNTNRARTKVYAVRETATGEIRTVGSTCLEPYAGIEPGVTNLLWLDVEALEAEGESDDWGWGGSGGTPVVEVDDVLRIADVVTRDGYRAGGDSVNDVRDVLWPSYCTQGHADTVRAEAATVDAADIRNRALAALEGQDDDFAENIRAVLSAEYAPNRTLGMTVAVLAVVRRAERQEAERIDRETPFESGFMGEKKERLKGIDAKVLSVTYKESDFGTFANVVMRSADGHRLYWKCSNADNAPEKGADVRMKAVTVKEREDYKGVDTTVLARPIFEAVPDEEDGHARETRGLRA